MCSGCVDSDLGFMVSSFLKRKCLSIAYAGSLLCGLSQVELSGGYSLVEASRCSGFSCCRAQALGHTGFSSCGSWAQQ